VPALPRRLLVTVLYAKPLVTRLSFVITEDERNTKASWRVARCVWQDMGPLSCCVMHHTKPEILNHGCVWFLDSVTRPSKEGFRLGGSSIVAGSVMRAIWRGHVQLLTMCVLGKDELLL
jgi:hypothetical protein